jgi:hypothetical protein
MTTLTFVDVEAAANERYADAAPGFGQAAEAPTMTTPMVPAAVAMTVAGSTLCLVC